jgi:hypothetical protein
MLKKIGRWICSAAGWIACGATALFFWRKTTDQTTFDSSFNTNKIAEKAAKAEEEVRSEIKKSDPAELISGSANSDAHNERVTEKQRAFRERVRIRFKQKL